MAEVQREFSVPSPQSGRRGLAKKEGIEVMWAMGGELFKDRPDIVQDHARVKRFCHCDYCDEYYREGKFSINEKIVVMRLPE